MVLTPQRATNSSRRPSRPCCEGSICSPELEPFLHRLRARKTDADWTECASGPSGRPQVPICLQCPGQRRVSRGDLICQTYNEVALVSLDAKLLALLVYPTYCRQKVTVDMLALVAEVYAAATVRLSRVNATHECCERPSFRILLDATSIKGCQGRHVPQVVAYRTLRRSEGRRASHGCESSRR